MLKQMLIGCTMPCEGLPLTEFVTAAANVESFLSNNMAG